MWMVYLFFDKVLLKFNVIGKVIVGGEFKFVGNIVCNGEGEFYYCGENVMLGYVLDVVDLVSVLMDEWFVIGDLVIWDIDGDYIIIGCIKCMIKVVGEWINFDIIE